MASERGGKFVKHCSPDPSGRDLMFLPYARLEEARILARRRQEVEARRLDGDVLQMWREAEAEFRPFVAAVRAESTQVGRQRGWEFSERSRGSR